MTARLLFAPQRSSSRKSAAYRERHKAVLGKITRKRQSPEFRFHCAAFEFLTRVLPKECVVFHPRNESRDETERKRGAAIGVAPGLPDLICLSPHGTFCFELKTGIRKLSKAQRDMHARLEVIGIRVATVRTLEEIERHLRAWGFAMRGRVA